MAKEANPSPKKILVRMPNWLGDLVMATPVIEALAQKFPEAKITVMCLSHFCDIFKHDPHVDEVLPVSKSSGWLRNSNSASVVEDIQKGKFDLGVLTTNSFSSAYLFWRGKVKQRVGFTKDFRRFLLTDPVPKNQPETMHQVLQYQELLKPLGIPNRGLEPKLYVTEEEKLQAKSILANYGVKKDSMIIGINPGAAYGSAKCWPPERFKKLARELTGNKNLFVAFFGDKGGKKTVNEICEGLGSQVINLAGGTTIRQLIAMISVCDIFLSNDSGPMHVASALQIPLVAIFGSTSDVKTGPFKKAAVIHKHVPCSPCYKRVCPIDFRCMTRINVEEVYSEIEKFIGELERQEKL